MPSYESLELLDEIVEPAGFAYDPVQHIFYSRRNGWQRKYGYCRAYDEAAAHFSMIFHCEPFYFYYDNKEWLLEFWKGQYGMTTGGEVGLYFREKPFVSELSVPMSSIRKDALFQAAGEQDFPYVSMRLFKKEQELFRRSGRHWWLTGFILGEFSKREQLHMETMLIFKNTAMAQAAAKAIRQAGYNRDEVELWGKRVYFSFGKPKTKQPLSQKKLFVLLKQLQNYLLCKKYRKFVGQTEEVPDKLLALYRKRPRLFQKLLRIGGNRGWKKRRMPFRRRKDA